MKRIHVLLVLLGLTIGLYLLLRRAPLPEEEDAPAPPAPVRLVQKYGPKLYSQHNEELVIRDFFNDQRGGVFVDIGASHYQTNSTTYYLEKHLDWSGIAVDAICDYGKGYQLYRKKTRFFCFFVSDRSDQEADFYINLDNKRVSTGNSRLAKRQGQYDLVKVPSITLNDLLSSLGMTRFDFLSMDIEFAEPAALAGFDIDRYRPSLVCIEAHRKVRQAILDYFKAHRYRRLAQYDIVDRLNYYFAPPAGEEGKPGDER
jgi:FkbM family methyltransferase